MRMLEAKKAHFLKSQAACYIDFGYILRPSLPIPHVIILSAV
jgi:hypothetical protein